MVVPKHDDWSVVKLSGSATTQELELPLVDMLILQTAKR